MGYLFGYFDSLLLVLI